MLLNLERFEDETQKKKHANLKIRGRENTLKKFKKGIACRHRTQ